MISSILIIEDCDVDSEFMLRALHDQCRNIHRVRTLAEGIKRLSQDPPDVVLLDVGLPDALDSDHAITSVKAVKLERTAIVVVSGNADSEDIASGILCNASGWIVKGNWGVLLHEVRAACDSHRHNTRINKLKETQQ